MMKIKGLIAANGAIAVCNCISRSKDTEFKCFLSDIQHEIVLVLSTEWGVNKYFLKGENFVR